MSKRTRTFQCPGCFSVSDLADRGRGHWYECECGERLTMIDLRGNEMIPAHEVIRPARERDEARAEVEVLAEQVARMNVEGLRDERRAAAEVARLTELVRLDGERMQRLEAARDSFRDEVARWKAEAERLREASNAASGILDSASRDPQAAHRAYIWLRTGYPPDHPNYLTPEQAQTFAPVSAGGETDA